MFIKQGLKQSQTTSSIDSNSNSPNQIISKLKQDLNYLAIQLIYERHLRNKYEEDSNRLHFTKIECEQLKVEKSNLEKNLKQLVEQYKSEIEECLSVQKKVELDAYRIEIEEKNLFIEYIYELNFSFFVVFLSLCK